ncbi:MAG: hypothetical protein ACREBR_05400 [bacterium]
MKYKISKGYTTSVKLDNGSFYSFTTKLETEVEITTVEQLIAESEKLFAQTKWLTERDRDATFGTGA